MWALPTVPTPANIKVTGRSSSSECFDADDSQGKNQLPAKPFYQHLEAPHQAAERHSLHRDVTHTGQDALQPGQQRAPDTGPFTVKRRALLLGILSAWYLFNINC